MTAGTDIHSIHDREIVGGVGFENKINDVAELIEEIKNGRAHIAPSEYFEKIKNIPLDREISLNVYALTDEGLKITHNYFAE
jgi:hypothetical protein